MSCIDLDGYGAMGPGKEIGGAAVGPEAVDEILASSRGLEALVADSFAPNEGVYRIDDFGDYVAESDFDRFWAGRPAWHRMAWMLADNGQYSSSDVASMSIGEIEAAFDDPGFEPEYVFYTEADELGCV